MLSALPIVLAIIAVHYVDGNRRIIFVSKLISDDAFDNSGEGSTLGVTNTTCCVYGNCSCNSLDHALANLTSNVLINITTDIVLSSLINKSSLENVSIIGHNNPTVSCSNVGGIHVTFCHNCIIQGIAWNGCGTNDSDGLGKPVIMLKMSSKIAIKNCTFQYSKGQAILLSDVSGSVNINHCVFIQNTHYREHGAAIHYSSTSAANHDQNVSFTISNCNFTYNEGARSLVYIVEKSTFKRPNDNITIQYSMFSNNQGPSVYIMNHNIYLTGKVTFQHNTADNGAGIYITDNSSVVFSKSSDVMFIQNSATCKGGAIFLKIFLALYLTIISWQQILF